MNIKRFCVGMVLGTMLVPVAAAWDAADSAACLALADRMEQGFEDMLRYEERHMSQFNYKGWELWCLEVPQMLRHVAAHGDVNASTPAGFTALQVACYYADVELAKSLIESGADVNLRPMGWKGYGFPGDTPLGLLVRGMTEQTAAARTQIARVLVAAGAQPDAPMMDWVWGGSEPVVPFCYLPGEPFNDDMRMVLLEAGNEPLSSRTRTWRLNWMWYTPELIKKLLENGVSPNRDVAEKGYTLLMHLVRTGQVDLVNLALSKGADVKVNSTLKRYFGEYLFNLPVDESDSPETAVQIARSLVEHKANLKATHEGKGLLTTYSKINTPAAQAVAEYLRSKGVRR